MEKTRIYYEFRTINTNQTLVLENPAQVTFQCTGAPTNGVVINNIYRLETRIDAQSISFNSPWELVLNNNLNEIDVTQYTIRFIGTCNLDIIIKYFEQKT